MPASKWLEILNWEKMPLFGNLCELDFDIFKKIYYSSHVGLNHIESCLTSGLRNEYPPNNARIIGSPGIGKTTFLHYFKQTIIQSKKDGKKIKGFVEIMDLEPIIYKDTINMELLETTILKITISYFTRFEEIKKNAIFTGIIRNDQLETEKKITNLWSFYTENRGLFNERLFIALDGVDTLPQEFIIPIAFKIHNLIAHKFVRMWICIREIKYESLDEIIQQQINTLFPEPHKFPEVNLFAIFEQRINDISLTDKKVKNPFSEELCIFLQKFYNSDLRSCIAMLKRILEEVEAKDIKKSTDQEFIQNYFDRMATEVLFKCGEIPNMHDNTTGALSIYPIERDVLLLLANHNRIDNVFYEVLMEDYEINITKIISNHKKGIKFDKDFIIHAIEYLKVKKLIECVGEKNYILTNRGWALQKIVDTTYYKDKCKDEMIKKLGKQMLNKIYWDFVYINHEFEEEVLKKMIGMNNDSL